MAECSVSLRAMGDNLEPDRVTELLQTSPTYCHRKGDPNITSSGRRLSDYPEGIWIVESACDSAQCIDDHLQSLIQKMDGKQSSLARVKKEGLQLDVLIGVFGVEDSLGFSITEKTLVALGALGLKMDFDIYTA